MKKKILIFIQDIKISGGAEKVTSQLFKILSEKFDLSLLTISDFDNRYDITGKYYSFKENVGLWKKILNFLKISLIIRPFKIFMIIKLISPDLIISVMEYSNILSIFTKFLFRIKIPLILFICCNPKMAYQKELTYMNYLIKFFYNLKFVNRIITVSKGVQNILERDYRINKNKLKTIYNGLEIEKIKELKKNKIHKHKDIFYNKNLLKFITVGRLSEEKGHTYLIEAFYKVRKQIKDSKLIIIGEGPLKDKLSNLIKEKDLQNEVFLIGYKKNPFKYLARSDIFVFSSIYEALPTVLLEALACGLPIISTDCKTGPKEILDDGRYGILVNIEDSEDLAEKMIYLGKSNELIKKYSRLAEERAIFFKCEKFINEWINLVNDIFRKK